jgi:prephenate dehydrogenase
VFKKVTIIGPGLIGGSMGMALRGRKLAGQVVGVGRRKESLDKALKVGAIDRATLDLKEGVHRSELVVLATPIAALGELVSQLPMMLDPEALVTDVASAKAHVIEVVSSALRFRPDVSYIPSHPMAGSEKSGPLAASADLFDGAVCILTPLTNTFPESKGLITQMWRALGARVVSMTPQAHDRLVARISHVPHLAAAALLTYLEDGEMALCGGGLRDTTRVAGGDPELWLDICRENREEVRAALSAYIDVLSRMAGSLQSGDLGPLGDVLQAARDKRESLTEGDEKDRRPKQ